MLADSLSRLQVDKFRTVSQGMDPTPTPLPSTRDLGDRLAKLLKVSLGRTSLTVYRRPWQMLQKFIRDRLGLQILLSPLSAHTLALFIAFLAEKNYAASTVSSYISALSFPHRLASMPDPTKSEMIKLALRGYSKMNPSRETTANLIHLFWKCKHTWTFWEETHRWICQMLMALKATPSLQPYVLA